MIITFKPLLVPSGEVLTTQLQLRHVLPMIKDDRCAKCRPNVPSGYVKIANWKDPPFLMGKSTISMVMASIATLNYQRVEETAQIVFLGKDRFSNDLSLSQTVAICPAYACTTAPSFTACAIMLATASTFVSLQMPDWRISWE